MRYIQSFQNDAAIQAAVENESLGKPYIALNEQTSKIDWDTKFDPRKIPMTLEITGPGVLKIKGGTHNERYSLNGGDYVRVTGETQIQLNVNAGDIVVYRLDYGGKYYGTFKQSTAQFKVYGKADDYQVSMEFRETFAECSGLTDASNLILPEYYPFYQAAFQNCKNLVAPPKLPATTLPINGCYSVMFQGCSKLATAPELPATSLTENCYSQMFKDCTSLETAPELPATALTSGCYGQMFRGCTSLKYIKCLAIDKTASNCLRYWVMGVPSGGTFVKDSNATWGTGNNGIPSGWTVQDAQ